jgi:protein-S-isoprenylcysteine O-methyltransferase Ste14
MSLEKLKDLLARQPYIVSQLGVVVSVLAALGINLDVVWMEQIVNALFALLAIALQIWAWWRITPVAAPRDNEGNELVPKTP